MKKIYIVTNITVIEDGASVVYTADTNGSFEDESSLKRVTDMHEEKIGSIERKILK